MAGVAQPNQSTHTHSVDPPNFTGNTGNETAHTHTWNNIYQHDHGIANNPVNSTLSELPNGTNISDATFSYITVEN